MSSQGHSNQGGSAPTRWATPDSATRFEKRWCGSCFGNQWWMKLIMTSCRDVAGMMVYLSIYIYICICFVYTYIYIYVCVCVTYVYIYYIHMWFIPNGSISGCFQLIKSMGIFAIGNFQRSVWSNPWDSDRMRYFSYGTLLVNSHITMENHHF